MSRENLSDDYLFMCSCWSEKHFGMLQGEQIKHVLVSQIRKKLKLLLLFFSS